MSPVCSLKLTQYNVILSSTYWFFIIFLCSYPHFSLSGTTFLAITRLGIIKNANNLEGRIAHMTNYGQAPF